jgi:hypothetical protein
MENLDTNTELFPDHIVLSKIFIIREHKVMIDRDLAELYGVETRTLNQTVKRNLQRFPEDFMFQMTSEELAYWKSQIVISNKEKMGIRKPPFVFTEQGVAMLSSVLNSERAILVNIQIIRIFTRIRELLIPNKDILQKLMDLENKGLEHDKKIKLIFEYLQQLKNSNPERREFENRPRIGYKK